MSNLLNQFLRIQCPLEGHGDIPIGMLCISDVCKHARAICYKCIKHHTDHLEYCFDLVEISKLIETTSLYIKNEGQEGQLLSGFKKFKKTIIQNLQDLEVLLESNIKKFSCGSAVLDIAYKLSTQEKFEAQDLENIGNQLRYITEVQENKLQIRNTERILEQFKVSLESICNLKLSQITLHLDRIKQLVQNDQIIVKRLQAKSEEQWVLQAKGYSANTFKVINKNPLYFVGLHQPRLKSENLTAKIIYRIHEGRDLTQHIFEEAIKIEPQQLEIQNDCYVINFKPIKLEPQKEYTLTAQGGDKFYTISFEGLAQENDFIQFQSENLTNSGTFKKPNAIEDIQSLKTIGIFPAILVQERDT